MKNNSQSKAVKQSGGKQVSVTPAKKSLPAAYKAQRRVMVSVRPELHDAIRMLAASEGMTVKEFFLRAVSRYSSAASALMTEPDFGRERRGPLPAAGAGSYPVTPPTP